MNSNRENLSRMNKRIAYKLLYFKTDGKGCGLPSEMKPAEDWRELFEQWGYTTWRN